MLTSGSVRTRCLGLIKPLLTQAKGRGKDRVLQKSFPYFRAAAGRCDSGKCVVILASQLRIAKESALKPEPKHDWAAWDKNQAYFLSSPCLFFLSLPYYTQGSHLFWTVVTFTFLCYCWNPLQLLFCFPWVLTILCQINPVISAFYPLSFVPIVLMTMNVPALKKDTSEVLQTVLHSSPWS